VNVVGRRWVPLLLLGAGCAARLPRDLGDLPADRVSLAEDPDLAHLAQEGRDWTVEDLIRSKRASFSSAPDPSARLADLARSAVVHEEGVELRVLSWNLAFLDVRYLGIHVVSPHLEVRRDHLVKTLFGAHDVYLLQEVWSWDSAMLLGEAAEAAGYAWYAGDAQGHSEHGLFIAVRKDRIDAAGAQFQAQDRYDAARPGEFWPGPGVRRGYLTWDLQLAGTSTRMVLVDNHATSYPKYTRQRELQARQVGKVVSALPRETVAIVGGDLNSGPYYPEDRWTTPDGEVFDGWWRNAVAYSLWLHYGDLVDMFALANGGGADRVTADLVPPTPYPAGAPYGDPGVCPRLGHVAFTGTDCNSLYDQQYGGTEFPARLDHLFLRDPSGRASVRNAKIIGVETLDLGTGGRIEASDHYAVEATFRIR